MEKTNYNLFKEEQNANGDGVAGAPTAIANMLTRCLRVAKMVRKFVSMPLALWLFAKRYITVLRREKLGINIHADVFSANDESHYFSELL